MLVVVYLWVNNMNSDFHRMKIAFSNSFVLQDISQT